MGVGKGSGCVLALVVWSVASGLAAPGLTPAVAVTTASAASPADTSITSTEVGYLGSTLLWGNTRDVDRDCGFSTRLANGKTFWLFCDTAIYDKHAGSTPPTLNLRFSATAALAAPSVEPVVPPLLHEASAPALPTQFLRTPRLPGGAPPCAMPVSWTKGIVTVPGTNQVIAFYQTFCGSVASNPSYDGGVAEYTDANPGASFAEAANLTADTQIDHVFVNPRPGAGGSSGWRGYGYAPVISGRYLYVYGLDNAAPGPFAGNAAVHVARVDISAPKSSPWRTASNYRYWTGTTWDTRADQAADVMPDRRTPGGDGLSVAYFPQIHRFVMIHTDRYGQIGAGLFGPGGFVIRSAPDPWGPWTTSMGSIDPAPTFIRPTRGCLGTDDSSVDDLTCRAFLLHPELSAATDGNLYFSYYRRGDSGDSFPATNFGPCTPRDQPAGSQPCRPGRVRLARIPLAQVIQAGPAPTGPVAGLRAVGVAKDAMSVTWARSTELSVTGYDVFVTWAGGATVCPLHYARRVVLPVVITGVPNCFGSNDPVRVGAVYAVSIAATNANGPGPTSTRTVRLTAPS